MVETTPPPAFEVAEAHFLFQVQIIPFDAPAQLRHIDHRNEIDIRAERRQLIFGGVFLVFRPFD